MIRKSYCRYKIRGSFKVIFIPYNMYSIYFKVHIYSVYPLSAVTKERRLVTKVHQTLSEISVLFHSEAA